MGREELARLARDEGGALHCQPSKAPELVWGAVSTGGSDGTPRASTAPPARSLLASGTSCQRTEFAGGTAEGRAAGSWEGQPRLVSSAASSAREEPRRRLLF